MKTVYKNARIHGEIADIVCENGVITFVGKTDLCGEDLHGDHVFPGLIDIHLHGCGGYDCMNGYAAEVSHQLLQYGITAFLPTTMTVPFDKIQAVTDSFPQVSDGADILGYHLEGPYLAPKYAGAQNPEYLRTPSYAEFSALKNIRMVTVAPELAGAQEFIQKCNCAVSLGHTACDYDTACAAFDAGAVCLTHTCNAMSPIHHRDTGPIGAALDKGGYVQVIADGLHLHPSMVRMLYRLFGPERMVLISDAMPATGMPDGEYPFGELPVTVKNGVARTASGALAGSTSTLYDCVLSAINMGIPAEDAFRMASETPAQMLSEKRGKIAVGYRADLLITDENYRLKRVIKQ